MKDLPNPFWALLFMLMGCGLLIAVLMKVTAQTTQLELGVLMAVATAGASIISGSFGYIQGQRDGKNSVQVPLDPPTQTQVTVSPKSDPQSPKEN
ncbi:MAG: hypothetical protein JST28_09180 [Acidobacteria bacterium]|nr:hypothetical protein [Acidobacteriota bacterium]